MRLIKLSNLFSIWLIERMKKISAILRLKIKVYATKIVIFPNSFLGDIKYK